RPYARRRLTLYVGGRWGRSGKRHRWPRPGNAPEGRRLPRLVYVAYALVFAAPAQHLFDRLCAMLGRPELPRDPRFASAEERPKNIAFILDLATAWFAERPFDKAVEGLKTHDIPHSPIMSIADIFADPHFRERNM